MRHASIAAFASARLTKPVLVQALVAKFAIGALDVGVLDLYSQVIDGAQRAAAEQVGCELKSELITIDHAGQGAQEPAPLIS